MSLLIALVKFAAIIGAAGVLIIMLATSFAAVPWSKRPRILSLASDLGALGGSGSLYAEQGNQREARLQQSSGDEAGDGDGGGDGGGD